MSERPEDHPAAYESEYATAVAPGPVRPPLPSLTYAPPARVSLWEAVRRHWLLTILPAVVLVAAAAVVGLERSPTYTAESRLEVTVGHLDPNNPALPGLVAASADLAGSYSRAITAQPVLASAAKTLHTTTGSIRSDLSATPVPQSPVLRVVATSGTPSRAVALSVAASRGLASYVAAQNQNGSDRVRILNDYRLANLVVQRLQGKLTSQTVAAGPNPSTKDQEAISQTKATLEFHKLLAQTLANTYTTNAQDLAAESATLDVLNPATTASSDRRRKLELYCFIALVVGLALGVVLASVRASRRLARLPNFP